MQRPAAWKVRGHFFTRGGRRQASSFRRPGASDGLSALPRGSPVRTGEAASSKLPPQARGQPNRARDAARRGPVAPRSLGGRRRGRGQRASTVSTSATSARRPGPRLDPKRLGHARATQMSYKAKRASRVEGDLACEATAESRTTNPFPRALAIRRILAAACAGDEQRFGRFRAWAAREQNVLRRPRTTSSRRPSPRTRFRRHVPEP